MIDTTRGSRYAGALAILALSALLLTPFFFHRYTERQRREITGSLDPAREAASDVRLALAREVGAIRGYLLTRQQPLLAEYMMARNAEESALTRLAAVTGLDSAIAGKARRLEGASHSWNLFNDRLGRGEVTVEAAIARLPTQQSLYRAALNASEALEHAITAEMRVSRERVSVTLQRWTTASAVLALLAAATAGLMILVLRLALRQNILARTDPLTGLYNRRGFAELARRELARSTRTRARLTVVTFDLDGFKAVNDLQGHAAGDRLLKRVAQSIEAVIREIDLSARLGGDEFALMLPDNKAIPPERAVERVIGVILEHLNRESWPVTLSVGAVTVHDAHMDIDELIHESDRLMYKVKHAGKNGIRHDFLSPPPNAT